MLNIPALQTYSVRQSSNSENAIRGPSSDPADDDWGDFTTGSKHIGQGPAETLVQSLTEREMTICRYDDGVVEIDLKRPDIDRLVLSGGGAKGVAFSGMVKVLEQHQALDKIRSIFGSSAGAISAAFLASGMGHADFDKMSDEINLVSLLDSHNKVVGPIQHVSSVIGKGIAKIPGKAGTIGRLLFDLMPRLQTKALPLEALIREKMVESVQSHFNHSLEGLPRPLSRTDDALEQIKKNHYVTFDNLAALSEKEPKIKQLHITGTAMFDGRPQMVVFNASLTPELDVARAAHISGSLPVVFQKPSVKDLPFQTKEERTSFQDGGIMLNTPVVDLYEPQFPMSPIPESDQLILKFESGNGGNKKDRGTLTSALADKFVGVNYAARDAQEASGIKAFEKQTIIVPLKTEKGDFTGTLNGTVNFSMPLEHKNNLQQRLNSEVREHLKRRQSSETYTFNSIGGALLALDDRMFDAAANELQNDQASKTVIGFRQQVQRKLTELQEAITLQKKVSTSPTLEITYRMQLAINELDWLAETPEKTKWLAKKLNHGNVPNYMVLLQAVKRIDAENAGPTSDVLTKAIEEMGVRDIKTKSENFIREVIYPSLYRLGQPDSNVKVLTRAISDLRESKTPEDFNAVLNRIADSYVSRNFPNSSHPFKSTTVDQARAWLTPDR